MKKFSELAENREALKSTYLSKSYTQKDVENMLKGLKDDVEVYIQYNEPRSRGKVGGGTIKSVSKKGVVIRDKFTGGDMTVDFVEITRLDKMKKVKVNETEEINEGVDISKFADAMAKLTDDNDHMSARLLAAKLCGDKRIYEVVRATNNIIDYEGHNPISDYTYQLLNRVHEIGRKKYGQENWDKYIYSNT